MIARLADVGGDLFALHHRLSTRRQRLFFARPDIEAGQFVLGVTRELGVRLRRREPRAFGLQRAFGVAHGREGVLDRLSQRVETAIGVDERPMGGRVGQSPLVVLAMNFDQHRSQRPQRLCADVLVVDIGARASVGELDSPQDQLVANIDVLPLERRTGDVTRRQLEHRRHLTLI